MFLQILKLYPRIYSDGLDLDKLICFERNVVVALDNYSMSILLGLLQPRNCKLCLVAAIL